MRRHQAFALPPVTWRDASDGPYVTASCDFSDPLSIVPEARRYARCLMWSGLRAQAAMAHAMALQDPPLLRTLSGPGSDTSGSVESGVGGAGGRETPLELAPVCMVAVSGVTLPVLVELLAKANAGVPAGARLEVLLQNAVDAFVVGGTPLGLWALRSGPAAAAAGCRLQAGGLMTTNIRPTLNQRTESVRVYAQPP
jgi:hypothetical protein